MALQIAPFAPPRRQDLTPQNLAALPKMGPPDMVEANMKGIAGLGTAFEGAYARARERGAMDQLSEYYKTHPFAAGAAAPPGVSGAADSPAPGAAPTGGQLQSGQAVYQGLIARGIEPHVAAGMAGNVYTESRFNSGAVGDKGTAYGFAQWRGSRQQGLFAAAQARGTDWRDPEAQLDHMVAELKGPYAKVYAAAVASGNPGAATAILARGYERPAEWALRKTLGERTGMAQSLFASGQGGGGGPAPAPVAAAPMPPQAGAPPPVVGGGVSAPPPVGLPPPDPTPDNVANAKAIMQQPTSDPKLKAWAGQVLRAQPGAAALVPTADAPAPGAQQASLRLPNNSFVIPGTGEEVPVGSGPDRLNAGAPPPQQVNVPAGPGPGPGPAPPSPAAVGASPPMPPPDPRRVAAQAAAANAPAPGAVPAQFQPSGGDSTYAATADYAGAQRAGLVPPTTMGPGVGSMPSAAPPGAQQPGPARTPPPAAVPPRTAPAAPRADTANEMVEGIAQELVKRGMDPKEARVRAAGATWDDKGFRLGPYPNPAAEAALTARPAAAAPAAAPGAGGGAAAPAPAPAAAPGGAPQAPAGVFRPNEALAIAARGDPQVFAAMLRQYGDGSAANGKWALQHDGNGNWMKINENTGETVPLSQGQAASLQGDLILKPGDPRRKDFPGIPDDPRTYRVHPGARGPEITPIDEREEKTFERETGLRKEFEEKIKDYRIVQTALGRIEAAKEDPTGGGDMALMYSWLKILDPDTGIREGEYATVQNSGSLSQRWTSQYNALLSGEKLDPAVRADIVNRSRALVANRSSQAEKDATFYRGQAKRYAIPEDAVTGSFVPYKYEGAVKPGGPGVGLPGKGTQDAPYVIPDGQAGIAAIRNLPTGAHYVTPDGKPHKAGEF